MAGHETPSAEHHADSPSGGGETSKVIETLVKLPEGVSDVVDAAGGGAKAPLDAVAGIAEAFLGPAVGGGLEGGGDHKGEGLISIFMSNSGDQFSFNQLVALFLAEIIRSRRVSLKRAAEIAQRVVSNLSQTNSEKDALFTISQIEKDFSEVAVLRQALYFGYTKSDVKIYEQEIKEYAALVFPRNMVLSSTFLQDAVREHATIQELCLKYPEFCEFLFNTSEKADLLPELRQAAIV